MKNNNLISKNPVQRFKLGNQIIKAAGGVNTVAPTSETIGRYVRERNRSLFGSGWRWYDTTVPVGKSHVALDQEVEQNGWILKPDGSKIKSSLRNRQQQATPSTTPKTVQTNTKTQQIIPTAKINNEKIPVTQTKGKTISTSTKNLIQRKTKNINSVSFKTAFNNARNAGQETFNWKGQSYNTRDKGEENYVFQNGKWVNPISNITFQAPELQSEHIEIFPTTPIDQEVANLKLNVNVPQQTYDRTGVREFIRNKGINPYSFSGAQRRALRMVLNNTADDNDKLLVKGMGLFKKGGLISKSPIERFKQKLTKINF